MTTAHQQTFSCSACGRRFTWKPHFEGKRVTCKCGVTFIAAPDLPEAAPPPLVVAGTPAATVSTPADLPTAHPAPAEGYYDPRFPTRRSPHQMVSEDDERSTWRDWLLPSCLLTAGLAMRAAQVLWFAQGQSLSTPAAFGLLVCEIVIGAVALGGGALAAAAILSTTFGDVAPAILKFLAISAFVSACAYFAGSIDRDPFSLNGVVLAWHVVLLLYFVLLVYLFKLDVQEGLMATVLVLAVHFMLVFVVSRGMSPEAARALFYGW